MLVADHCTVFGLLLHLLPLGRAALHLITVGGSCAHLESLWLTLLPGHCSARCCKLPNLLVSSATLAAGFSMVVTAPSYAIRMDRAWNPARREVLERMPWSRSRRSLLIGAP